MGAGVARVRVSRRACPSKNELPRVRIPSGDLKIPQFQRKFREISEFPENSEIAESQRWTSVLMGGAKWAAPKRTARDALAALVSTPPAHGKPHRVTARRSPAALRQLTSTLPREYSLEAWAFHKKVGAAAAAAKKLTHLVKMGRTKQGKKPAEAGGLLRTRT